MKNTLYEIMNNLARKGFVFSNEKDFQLQVALSLLSKRYGKFIVKMECISLTQDWEEIKMLAKNGGKIAKRKREYHDLLVENKKGECFLIELKYKTPQKLCYYKTSQGENVTFAQGAYDHGTYYFLKDIERLQNVKNRHIFRNLEEKISKCYAILLTNDGYYRYNDFKHSDYWKNYSLIDGKVFSPPYIAFTNTPDSKLYNGFKAVNIVNDVGPLHWCDYKLKKFSKYPGTEKKCFNPGFSYLIVEIDISDNK